MPSGKGIVKRPIRRMRMRRGLLPMPRTRLPVPATKTRRAAIRKRQKFGRCVFGECVRIVPSGSGHHGTHADVAFWGIGDEGFHAGRAAGR